VLRSALLDTAHQLRRRNGRNGISAAETGGLAMTAAQKRPADKSKPVAPELTMRFADHALTLAQRGVPVFPCDEDKRPLVASGFKAASTDADVIRTRWQRWPDALIGVPAGIRFVVIDLDLQHAEAQQWLDTNSHLLPPTRTHRTRSGGLHVLFRPHPEVACSAGKLHPHVDTRGAGGYIIWWPAEAREVLHGSVLAHVPGWIVHALRPKLPAAPASARRFDAGGGWWRGLVRVVAGAPEGQRNQALFWAACRAGEAVHAGKAPREWIADLLVEAAARAGLAAPEAQRTVHSGLARQGRS
jgi:Bifunctional DNA primase/polymerase, N-terminal